MNQLHTRVGGLLCGMIVLPAHLALAQMTVAADTFVDSVGVNVHLHYNGTLYYDNFELVKSRLSELGVRHVRDGMVDTDWQGYYERHTTLGRAGIKGTFIAPLQVNPDLLRAYPGRMTGSFEAYEAPNEANDSGDAQWVAHLRSTLQQLHGLHDQADLQLYPVYGPSLTNAGAYTALGDVSGFIDFANLHNYFAGRNPGTVGWGADGFGSIPWNMELAKNIAGAKPIVTTETGYQTDPSIPDSVPEEIAGRYMPRLLLEQYRAGIKRTYIYELADFTFQNGSSSGSYGLLAADGRPKPAFNAVKSLLTLLADPGQSNAPPDLAYQVEGGGQELHHMAFGKRNGHYFVALWLERSSYDLATRRAVTAPGQQVTLKLPGNTVAIARYAWQPDGSRTRSDLSRDSSVSLNVGDTLSIVEVQASGNLLTPGHLRIVR